jgi:8-oxo-dGTP pyrophosphatase MutT (NUDIX family)
VDYKERWASLLAADGRWIPPEPRLAATMVLKRRNRILLMRRSLSMDFAPGMHVFPGGGLEDIDKFAADPLRACAIRETLEEVEILVHDCRLFDRWVTPESEQRRYDVSFFVAETSGEGRLVTAEADEMLWIEPQEALDRHDRGSLAMLRPTVSVLQSLVSGEIDRTPNEVIPKLPVIRADGTWDVLDARTRALLLSGYVGPRIAETDGGPIT